VNRIDARFAELRGSERTGLITFLTAGDPAPDLTSAAMHALVSHGADLIELGMPFSDPMADGPVIQQANERALAKGVGLKHVLSALAEFRHRDPATPVVLMGYLNPIERYGAERFIADAADAGADGLLLVDCPIEESASYQPWLVARGLKQIHLIAPTTPSERRQRIVDQAGGFVYYVSFKGITGAGHLEQGSALQAIAELKAQTEVPVAVGFGIKDAASAEALGEHADAIVIGSALIERMAPCRDAAALEAAVGAFLTPIRKALDH
jgi:tryptophan synthase alpha chain